MNWVAIAGSFEIDGDCLTFLGTHPDGATFALGEPPFGVLRSDIEFEKGEVELNFILESPDSRLQVMLPGGDSELFAGLNVLGLPYGFAVFRAGAYEPKGGAGQGVILPTHSTYQLKIAVDGANVSLYLNGVNVASTTYQTARGQLGLFFSGSCKIAVTNFKATSRQPICFVVMQFTEEFDALYREVIKPSCERFGYKVVRADEFYTSSMIIDDITRSLRDSALVIADITPDNPNVFYEVGYAHAIQTPTILLSDRTKTKLPFDVSGFRTIFYDNTIAGKSGVETALERHLIALSERWTSGSRSRGQGV
jgi:hypothetical protein